MTAKANALLLHPWCKPLVGLGLLLPGAWLVFATLTQQLGANPAEHLIRSTGEWTLRLLCLTLAVTPARQLTGWSALARLRRMSGLFVYLYAVLHLLCYSVFDMGLDWDDIVHDVAKRPFILVGVLGWTLLTLLAATSFNRAVRSMGARRWQMLHRSVYVIAGLAVLHFFWMRSAKHNYAAVQFYAAVLGALLAWRLVKALQSRLRTRTRAPAAPPA